MRKQQSRSSRFSWFKLNRALHRDIGYFCIGMTLIFGLSGIAVNHIEDWNPNYRVDYQVVKLNDLQAQLDSEQLDDWLIAQYTHARKQQSLAPLPPLKTTFWENPNRFRLFFKQDVTGTLDVAGERLVIERVAVRPVFRFANFLHLNEAKRLWTYVSDAYAVMLMFLALSALFMVKGKKGAWGPRASLVIAGFLVPIGFWLLYA